MNREIRQTRKKGFHRALDYCVRVAVHIRRVN